MPKSSMITNVVTVASLLWTLVASSYFNVLVLYVVMNPLFLLSKFTTHTTHTHTHTHTTQTVAIPRFFNRSNPIQTDSTFTSAYLTAPPLLMDSTMPYRGGGWDGYRTTRE